MGSHGLSEGVAVTLPEMRLPSASLGGRVTGAASGEHVSNHQIARNGSRQRPRG
jgi:hypothetical protein